METNTQTARNWTGVESATADPFMLWANEREIESIRQHRRVRAGVPARYLGASLENWEVRVSGEEDVLGVGRWYVENFPDLRRSGSGLVFCGGVGTGKTRMCCTLVNELLDRGVDAIYAKFPQVVNRVRDTYGRDGLSRSDILDELIDADLLALDEVGLRVGASDEDSILDDLIDGRYEQCRPTIVTSNLNRDALVQALGERAFDRLTDKKGALLMFDWESRRQG